MEYTSTKSAPQELIDLARNEGIPTQDIGVALAALIYLRWVDFQESEEEAFAAFEGDDYRPILTASLHWRTWHMLPSKEVQGLFAEQLPQVLEGLNNSRHNPLATHLHRISSGVRLLGQLSPSSLDVMIRWLADRPFETQNDRRDLLDVFDALLTKLNEKRPEFGMHYTPASITRLLIEIAAPAAGERIYDPCFGFAGFLTASYDYVKEKRNGFDRNGDSLIKIAGVEINLNAYLIGLTRLALAGIDDPQLELGNSLERLPLSNPQRDGFDLVFLNPPWGGRQKQSGLDHFPVRTSDTTGLFIQHALAQLRPQGRAVIIVPEGFLFRSGAEQRLRKMLLEQHTVEAVIALPAAVFMPYTSVKPSILVLTRGGQTERVRMFDTDTYFDKGKGKQPATISDAMSLKLAEGLRAIQPVENSWDVDVATLAEVEWDFSPRRRNKGGLSGVLDALRSKVEVQLLKECCDIIVGRAVKSTDLVNNTAGADLIPYVRIKDVERGQATKGSSWLSPEATASVDPSWKLRTGDVLLSKSGTIGKTGVVRNGAVGAIAANGFFVIRPDQDRVDPHYLRSYFDSFECRAWLESKARGATIQHLSRNVIEELPILVPPMQMQQRIAKQCREYNEDAIVLLNKIITGDESDPLSIWLEKFVTLLPPNIDSRGAIIMLDQMARHVGFQYNMTIGEKKNAHLEAWFDLLTEAIRPFKDCEVPPGPGLLSIIMESARGLNSASNALKGQSLSEDKARFLNKYLTDWVDAAKAHLLNDINIVLGIDKGSPHDFGLVNIPLWIHNEGVLPLLDVKITTSPYLGDGKFNYLAEKAKVTVNLKLLATYATEQVFTFVASWSGVTLDGQQVSGSRELAFDVREAISVSVEPVADLGGSPYVCGVEITPDRDDVFFGREELLDQIRRQVVLSGNVILLEGNRRAGKSSILRHLEGVDAIPGWIGVYCDLLGTEGDKENRHGVPTVDLFRAIAIAMAKGLRALRSDTPLPDGTVLPVGKLTGIADASISGIKEASPFIYFREYMEVVLNWLANRNLKLLLMLDEFDKIQEGIDNRITSSNVPENIRSMVQRYPNLSAILTGSRRLKRLREEYWSALFGLGTRFGVTSLSPEAAAKLVIEPVKNRLVYSKEAVDRAIYLTAGQPFLLQCLCSWIFSIAAKLKTQSITLDLVDKAAEELVPDNEHFAALWGYAKTDFRRFILALCHRETEGPDPFQLSVIQEKLGEYGIDINADNIMADLDFLRELELIDLTGETYSLSIPLMGMWIDMREPFAELMSKARSETEDLHA